MQHKNELSVLPQGSIARPRTRSVVPNLTEPHVQRLLLLCILLLLAVSGWSQDIYLGNSPATGARCHCLNNATTLSNGQFRDTVTVASGVTGETWTVDNASVGAFSNTSPAPPAAPISVNGQTLTEVSPGVYRIIIRHVDASTYTLRVSNGMVTRTISNTCYYPNVAITSLPDTVCLTSAPVALTADNGGAAGTGAFRINGQVATVFNAQLLGVGSYTVSYTFDAGTGTAGSPADPGCTTTVSKTVIVPNQPNTAVVALVNVTLGDDCQAVITPEMVMAGDYPCMDDFMITVYDQNGFAIGNVVNGTHVGFRLNVRVMSRAGFFIGDGQIDIFDVNAPSITCPPGNTMPAITNQVQLLNATIPATAPTFIPNNFSCYNAAVAPASGLHYYTLTEINVTQTDVYTIELNMNLPGGGVFGIYQGAFNPFQGPCQGIVGIGEPLPAGEGYYTTAANGVTRIHVMLMPGMPYTLLTTAYAGNQIGAFQYAIYSEGNGQVVGLPAVTATIRLPLYCTSIAGLLNNNASVNLLGAPVVNDACMLNPLLTFTDQFINGGNCSVSTINRTFRVVDQAGNSNQCTQRIDFFPITLEEVNLPPKTVNISCGETFAATPNGNPHPSVTGYPFIITAIGTFNIAPVYCNMLATYEDLPHVQVCQGTEQFLRRWVVFDDCDPSDLIRYEQLIIIGDRTAPVIVCSAGDVNFDGITDTLVYVTQGSSCTAVLEAPRPTVTDDCSGWTLVTELVTQLRVPVTNPFGQIIGFTTQTNVHATISHNGNRLISNVPVGTHFFRYTATDNCGNVSVQECPMRVSDFALPTAACDDLIHISIGGNGQGTITAQDIDEGSNDNCGPVSLQIRRRMDFNPTTCAPTALVTTPWAPSINVYCCEAGDTVRVDLLVTDVVGNINTCSTDVVVRDNTAPTCLAPQPVNISCAAIPEDTDFNDTEVLQGLFGTAQGIDLCAGTIVTELAPTVTMQSCGLGNILRRFTVRDASGNSSSCQQVVSITTSTSYAIKFPRDVTGDCIQPGADTLVVNSFGCDQFAINSDDVRYNVTDGSACYKIIRTYTVINWCEYDGFSAPVVLTRNAACEAEGGTRDMWLIRRPNNPLAFLDADNNPANGFPAQGTRGTSCDGQTNPAGHWLTLPSIGYWKYTQVIKVTNTTPPTITAITPQPFCANATTCQGNAVIEFTTTSVCDNTPPTILVAVDPNTTGQYIMGGTITGTFPNYQVRGTYPIGNHRLRIRATGACGGVMTTFVDFRVVDCTAPTLICTSTMSVNLMAQPPNLDADGDGDFDAGAASVIGQIFISQTGQDCTGGIRSTIHRIADLENGTEVAFPNRPALVVTCDDVGFVPARVYLWDSANNPLAVQPSGAVGGPNYTTCDVLLSIQDNQRVCTTATAMGVVSGLIMTEEGQPVAGVGVSPRDDMGNMMMTTEDDGLFNFELTTSSQYMITPYSPEDYLNGVSTLDIIFISKHILNVQRLDTPYKLIAADINRSNSVTTLDLVHLRKAVLGITQGFPGNQSWRFVHAGFEFPDPTNPWLEPFPETVSIPALAGGMTHADFIAVKVGDINGSARTNTQTDGSERAAADVYYLRTDEVEFKTGETLEATFVAANPADEVQGFQMTLQFDPATISLDDIEWGLVGEQHVNRTLAERGLITISWDAAGSGTTGEGLTQGEASFFTLRFKAQTKGRLSEAIAITSRQIKAEAYGLDDSLRGMDLNFAPAEQGSGEFFLEQNRPNPFGDQTVIGFQIPTDGDVTLTIYDTNGRVVQQYKRYYAAGYNQIWVAAQDIAARGLLYYKLETDQYAATKKMVILGNE